MLRLKGVNVIKRIINVVEFDPQWATVFAIEKTLLGSFCGSNAVSIEHIGSTSVKGLAAKPIIDILIEVSSLKVLDDCNRCFEAAGYHVKGENGIARRRYFQKGGFARSHHVHVFETNDVNLLRHRAFKMYLIAHPDIAAAYGRIKREAACQSHNAETYMALKNNFIQHHQTLALKWTNAI